MKLITKKNQFKAAATCLLIFMIMGVAQAQVAYRQTQVTFTIAGTSTMHDWTMTSKEATIQAGFSVGADGVLQQVNALTLTLPSESLKSGKGAMDKNAYSSLKTSQFKQINFNLVSAKIEGNVVKGSGNLVIAGVTRPIEIEAVCTVKPDNSISCKGSKAIKMTDYKVEPPTFMFGSIKTGDDITISFETNLSPIKL